MGLNELYAAAKKADALFAAELVRVYGGRASDARYFAHHIDGRVTAAASAKVAADDAWLTAYAAAGR